MSKGFQLESIIKANYFDNDAEEGVEAGDEEEKQDS